MTSVERQVRLLLRAWPRPDRLERGEEILATTLDFVPPARRRLPLALAASLLVGGLRARWRARPPIWHWLHYAMDAALPPRWHRWMLNDLLSPGWYRRLIARRVTVWMALSQSGVLIFSQLPPPIGIEESFSPSSALLVTFIWLILSSAVGGALTGSKRARRRRARILAENGYDELGRPDPLAGPRRRFEDVRRGRRGPDRVSALKAAMDLGAAMGNAGQLNDAISVLNDTFERAKRVAPKKEYPTWLAGHHLAEALARDGRLDEAIPVSREVLTALQQLHGRDDIRSLEVALMLGQHLASAGQLSEAIPVLSDTFLRAKRVAPDEDSPTWSAGAELAQAFTEQGRVDDALGPTREVFAAQERLHGPDHLGTLRSASFLGTLLRKAGRLDEAVDLLADPFARAKRHFPDDDWPTWWSGHELALVLEEVVENCSERNMREVVSRTIGGNLAYGAACQRNRS